MLTTHSTPQAPMPESLLNLPEILASHARWLACDPSGQRASLVGANLDGARLDGASLVGANLDGASLVGANLDGANLDGASLNRANLDGASLDGARLVGATGIVIAADAPQRLRAAAAAALQEGALEMGAWHSCDTTHCLGGWLIHQAGEVGRLLEATVGPGIAGLMLGGVEAHSHFYDSNEAATEWLRSVLAQPEAKS
jgi:hypothetical protein